MMLLCSYSSIIRKLSSCVTACMSWHVRHYIYSLIYVGRSHFISQRLIPSMIFIIILHVRLSCTGCPCEIVWQRVTPYGMSLPLPQINLVPFFISDGVHHTYNFSEVLHEMSVLDTSWEHSYNILYCGNKDTHNTRSKFISTVKNCSTKLADKAEPWCCKSSRSILWRLDIIWGEIFLSWFCQTLSTFSALYLGDLGHVTFPGVQQT